MVFLNLQHKNASFTQEKNEMSCDIVLSYLLHNVQLLFAILTLTLQTKHKFGLVIVLTNIKELIHRL